LNAHEFLLRIRSYNRERLTPRKLAASCGLNSSCELSIPLRTQDNHDGWGCGRVNASTTSEFTDVEVTAAPSDTLGAMHESDRATLEVGTDFTARPPSTAPAACCG
jgi:hypothetical protein